jgi:hypothetical protein
MAAENYKIDGNMYGNRMMGMSRGIVWQQKSEA